MSTPLRIAPVQSRSSQRGALPSSSEAVRRGRIWTAAGGLLLLAVVSVVGIFLLRGPHGAAIGPYHVRLDRGWMAYFQQNETWLGAPTWAEHPYQGQQACVGFENAIACRLQDSRGGTEDLLESYALLDLGRQTLPKGVPPEVTSPAPIAQLYLDHLSEAGVNWRYWLGGASAISRVFCIDDGSASEGGACLQYWPNQRLWWPRGSEDPNQVHLTELVRELPRP